MSMLARIRLALGFKRNGLLRTGTLVRRIGLGRRRMRWAWR